MIEEFRELLESGALVVVGYNRAGHPIFEMTETMEDHFPRLYELFHMNNEDLLQALWFKDFIEFAMGEDGTMSIAIRENITEEEMEDLSEPERRKLISLIEWKERMS